MATLFLVKTGRNTNGDRVTPSHAVSVEAVAKALPTTKAIWTVSPPTFNPKHVTKDFEHPQHVVPEVETVETFGRFDKPGFYTLDISPKDATERLGLIGPSA